MVAVHTSLAQRFWKKLPDDIRSHTLMPDVWRSGCWLWERDVDEEGFAIMPTRWWGTQRVQRVLYKLRHPKDRWPPEGWVLRLDRGCTGRCVNPWHAEHVRPP